MKNIIEMRKQRAKLVADARELTNGAENGVLNAEAQTRFDAIMADVTALGAAIQREEQISDLEASLNQPQEVRTGNVTREVSADEAQAAEKRYAQAFRNVLARSANAEDMQLVESRAQAAGNDAAGGYTVPTELYNQIMVAASIYGGVRQAGATVLRTASGNPIPVPTNDDTANVATIVGENTAATEKDLTFGSVTLGAYAYSSGIVRVSRQLMTDSAFDLDAFIKARFAERFGRGVGAHLVNGNGTSQPQGVAAASTLGKQAGAGQATSVSYNDLVDLFSSVDPAYRHSAAWLMHDQTLGALIKLTDGEGRPLFVPSLQLRAPDTLLGKPVQVDNAMPQMAAGARSILFGDFSQYIVRDVEGMFVQVLNERYAEFAQIAFLGFSRHDAKLVNAAAIKHYRNT